MSPAQDATRLVAANIRGEMGRQRMSAEKLSALVGMQGHTLRRKLRGETPMTVDELDAIAQALRVDTADLLARRP